MYCRVGYQQSIPLEWLLDPSEQNRTALLEFSRGTLYSLSNTGNPHGEEVHISRLHHAFHKLGAPSLCRVGMKLLNFLREAEYLPGGYWLSTPFRTFEIEGQSVFVGALPTSLGFLGEPETEGLCRIVSPDIASRLPRQDIASWMGIPPSSPTSQVAYFFQQHQRSAAPINLQDDLEYLGFSNPASKRISTDRHFFWGSRALALTENQIAICRQKMFGYYRYFSSDIRSGQAITEGTIEQSLSRLLFALAHYTGNPALVSVRNRAEDVEISIAEHLPQEEYRLALLLSRRIVRQGHRRTYYLSHQLAPALLTRLQELGCLIETEK